VRIAVIGAGYVGLVSGACFSDFGFEVVIVDKDKSRIARLEAGKIPIYEPGLEDLVARNRDAGRLSFTASLPAAMKRADAVFIAVGTPTRRGDGFADLTYVYAAADEIARCLAGPCVVVCKSTVPIGTNREVLRRIKAIRPDAAVDVASNPEFLREGSAIEDFKRPDRVVVGAESEQARAVMQSLYRPLSLNETPILFTGLETAELIKYAANAFLATKITFINEVADLCERVGANVQEVARGIGLDRRIGPKFLHAGPGYGGSCFPKDTLALVSTARSAGAPIRIVEAVVDVNEARKRAMAERVLAALDGDLSGKTVAVLGLTFKPNTDDMREAPSLVIVPALQAAGARIRAHDPEGMAEAAKLLDDVEWCDGPYHAAEGSDAIVVITEWDAYRALDVVRLKRLMKGDAFFDLRNIYKTAEMADRGFRHFGIGIGQPGIAEKVAEPLKSVAV
jgi:UDPglucose 6-dehydrogenase